MVYTMFVLLLLQISANILSAIDTLVIVLKVGCYIFRTLHLPLTTHANQPPEVDLPFVPFVIYSSELPNSFIMPYISDMDTDTDSEYHVDEEYADIEYTEQGFEETDKIDGQYYLGLPFTFRALGETLLNCSISASSFLSNDYARVVAYLGNIASFVAYSDSRVEILQLHISDHGEYTVVVKTIWLRLIQRRWKTVMRLRREVLAKRASVQNQLYFQTHGNYLPGTRVIPGLLGMMKVQDLRSTACA